MLDVTVNLGGSVIEPHKFTVSSGLSLMFLFAETSRLGFVFNSTKINCAECNTPVAEITGGSLIIKSKHHGERHTTAIPVQDLQVLAL